MNRFIDSYDATDWWYFTGKILIAILAGFIGQWVTYAHGKVFTGNKKAFAFIKNYRFVSWPHTALISGLLFLIVILAIVYEFFFNVAVEITNGIVISVVLIIAIIALNYMKKYVFAPKNKNKMSREQWQLRITRGLQWWLVIILFFHFSTFIMLLWRKNSALISVVPGRFDDFYVQLISVGFLLFYTIVLTIVYIIYKGRGNGMWAKASSMFTGQDDEPYMDEA